MGVSGGGWGGLLARGDGGGVGWRSRVELQSTEVEVDRGLEVLAVAVAAGRYPDGLDAGVQAFGAGGGDRVGEVGQQSTLDQAGQVEVGLWLTGGRARYQVRDFLGWDFAGQTRQGATWKSLSAL